MNAAPLPPLACGQALPCRQCRSTDTAAGTAYVAQAELSKIQSPVLRVQRLAVYARIFAAELLGTVLAVPFGLRALSIHRSLPDARTLQRAGTVSMLRDVR